MDPGRVEKLFFNSKGTTIYSTVRIVQLTLNHCECELCEVH